MSHRLYNEAQAIVSKHINLVAVSSSDDPIPEEEFEGLGCEIVISFLNSFIFKKSALLLPNVNFHPSTPRYPGIGGAARALYDDADIFGVTAHRIVRRVDAGEIYRVKTFPIKPGEDSLSLRLRTERVALELLDEITSYVKSHGALPPVCGEVWSDDVMTKKKFQEWMILDPDNPEEFSRKIRAIRNPEFEGPFVDLHGFRFALLESK